LHKYDPIERPIYDPETGEEVVEFITPYDLAKDALMHEFEIMTLDELLGLYRHFADNKISSYLDNTQNQNMRFKY